MSNYSQSTFFGPKDALTPGDPLKKIKGTEIDAELALLSTAIATKADNTGPTSSFTSLTDPGADRVVFWDDSAGAFDWLSPIGSNSGLAIAGTSMTVDITGLTLEGTLTSAHYFMIHNGTALRKVQVSQIPHNSLTGYVANEHINHTSVSISAGTGLSGGGTIAANRTLSLDTGSTLNTDHASVSISAGTGLTGGGTIAATRTLALDTSSVYNVDHSAVSVIAGTAMSGGGTIAASRTLNFDMSAVTALSGPNSVGADYTFIVANGSTHNKLLVRDMGMRRITASTRTIAASDMAADHVNTSSSSYTYTIPSSAPCNEGCFLTVRNTGTGTITFAAAPGASIVSLDSRLTVKASGGVAELKLIGSNVWHLCGALE